MGKIVIYILMIVVGGIIGCLIGTQLYNRPTKIEFKVSPYANFLCGVAMFTIIFMIMMFELLLDLWVLQEFQSDDWRSRLLCMLIDGGILIAIALPVLSKVFAGWIKGFNLDLCNEYNSDVIKKYYSCSILFDCIWLLILFWNELRSDNLEVHVVISRVLIWIISVMGTWAGIGFKCEGRIDDEVKNYHISKNEIDCKYVLEYIRPLIIGFIFICFFSMGVILEIEFMKWLLWGIYSIVMSGMVGMFIAVLWLNHKECYSERRSKKELARAIKKISSEHCVQGYYKTIQYALVNGKNEKYILIYEKNVIWDKHENEVEGYFGRRQERVEVFDYMRCSHYLENLWKSRREFIRKGFELCENEVKDQLIEKKLKN